MGKKKPARNAFFYFMVEFKEKNPRRFADMQEVAALAGPKWEAMDAEQRKPYEIKANKSRSAVKYTTTGVSIDVMQQRINDENMEKQKMKDDIEETIRNAVESDQIADQFFYLIHINQFCYCNQTRQYIPAEIAICRFSLNEGVANEVYHAIIKPGPLPIGYLHIAQKLSTESHQLEVPCRDDKVENNRTQVMDSILKFMTQHNNLNSMPPLYAESKNIEIVQNVLKYFCYDFGYKEDLFKIYSLEYFFYTLRNGIGDGDVPIFPTISLSKLELEKDCYDFAKGIPCKYHSLSEVPNHCSRSHVYRFAFIICDNCCGDLGIELIPGRHVPSDANVTDTRPTSRADSFFSLNKGYASSVSSVSSAFDRKKPTDREVDHYLSERTESVLSTTDISSVYDDSASMFTTETDFDQENPNDVWLQPKQKRKHTPSDNTFDLKDLSNSYLSSGPSTSKNITSARLPSKLSAALSPSVSGVGASNSSGLPTSRNVLPFGKGRGRGIGIATLANLNKN